MERLNGEVGEVRRERSLARIGDGRCVVLGGLRVLSLSRTRARIVGFVCLGSVLSLLVLVLVLVVGIIGRCSPNCSGKWAKVGMVR